jgi:hypothetical protein
VRSGRTHKYGILGRVKTTLEIPDGLFREIKSRAAARGQTLKQFVNSALQDKLSSKKSAASGEPEWMKGFGKLRRLRAETKRIQARIHQACEVVEPEDRA